MGKVITFCIVGFLIAYYAFTSGAIFELTKSEAIEQLDIPYSIALSNERTRIVGVCANDDDTDCAKWLVEETDPSIPIYVDYCSTSLIMDLDEMRRRTYKEPEGNYYLFLTSWSTEHKKMVFGWFEGLREYEPLPDLSNATEVFRRGNAVVYAVGDIIITDLNKVAIVFMDIWGELPWPRETAPGEWLNWWDNEVGPHVENKIVPLLALAREHQITIVFSCFDFKLSPKVEQKKYNEPIINLGLDLDYYLKGKGIDTILYAGYATNLCILERPTGIRFMYKLGYNIILIEDCSLPVPAISYSYEEALAEIEKIGIIITSKDLEEKVQWYTPAR